MKKNAFLKIFAAVMFVAFAAVSCWSTTESLFLTLESAQIPKWVFWVATVGLFVLTSYCTKLVVDSLNSNIVMEGRKPKLMIGIMGIVLFWLLFSMPTNTHTFFYKQMAKDTAVAELTSLRGNLASLTNEASVKQYWDNKWNDFDTKVKAALKNLDGEIRSAKEPGFGQKAEKYLRDIEDLFGLKQGTIRREKTTSTSLAEINRVCLYYNDIVTDYLSNAKAKHDQEAQVAIDNFVNENAKATALLSKIDQNLSDLEKDGMKKEVVLKQSRAIIKEGTSLLRTNEESSPSKRLTNVIKVWSDYFHGRYKNTDYTLWYWILLAVIVDVAAFAFFAIAFRKES
jgi:hypothetical protein